MTIRALLVDDHVILRNGLARILASELHIDVVGEADNGKAAVERARSLKPDLIMMDIAMPDLNGIEATIQIRKEDKDVKIIALSMHADARYVAEMLSAGVSGYLLKDSTVDELRRAIDTVMAKRTYLSPSISGGLVSDYLSSLEGTGTTQLSVLSSKEREVLQLLAEGKSTKEIAESLNVSPKTVETHRMHVMEKLDLHTVAELTKYAIRSGLTTLE